MFKSDEMLCRVFLGLGLVMLLASMVLGPLNYVNLSVAAGITAGFVALVGIYFAFQSWNEPELPTRRERRRITARTAHAQPRPENESTAGDERQAP